MSIVDIARLLVRYETTVRSLEHHPQREVLNHLLTMFPEMHKMNTAAGPAENREKLMRWIGFVQGVLFSTGVYTIEMMKFHNRGILE